MKTAPFCISLLLFSVALLPLDVHAQTEDVFFFGENVELKQETSGDAYAAGGSVLVDSAVTKDALLIGEEIVVNESIGGDLRALGVSVLVKSTVWGNASIVAFESALTPGTEVFGNVNVWASEFNFDGKVHGNVNFWGETVRISGTIDGDVTLHNIVMVEFGEEAFINGNLSYRSEKPITIPSGHVAGETNAQTIGKHKSSLLEGGLFWEVVWLFAHIAVGMVLLRLFSGKMKEVTIRMVEEPGRAVLFGILFFFFLPLSALVLMITLIGIPLGVGALFIWIFFVYISELFAAIIIGKLLMYQFVADKEKIKKNSPVWFLILGLITLEAISLVPYLGGIVNIFVLLWGLGGIFLAIRALLSSNKKSSPKAELIA